MRSRLILKAILNRELARIFSSGCSAIQAFLARAKRARQLCSVANHNVVKVQRVPGLLPSYRAHSKGNGRPNPSNRLPNCALITGLVAALTTAFFSSTVGLPVNLFGQDPRDVAT
jgi:hypothetical protein